MKKKILEYLNNKLEEIESELIFDEGEFQYWRERVELMKEIIDDVEKMK